MASKIEILIRNERESVIELSGVTDVNGHPVSLAPKGMEHDSRRCYDSVVTHQHVQTFLDQTPPWISVMKLNSDGTIIESSQDAAVESEKFDTSELPPTESVRVSDIAALVPADKVELVTKIEQEIEDFAKAASCTLFAARLTVFQSQTRDVKRTLLSVYFDYVPSALLDVLGGGVLRTNVPAPESVADATPEVAPEVVAEVIEDPIAVEPTPELLPVDDDALGPLPDLEEPTEIVEAATTSKRRKSRNS
jgi:hypothetical protein